MIFLFLLLISSPLSASWAEQTLQTLSLREKIGQLFIVAVVANERALTSTHCYFEPYRVDRSHIDMLISDYAIGGIIFLGNSTLGQQIVAINIYQSRARIPLLIAQDCEWGLNQRIPQVVPFPKQKILGALENSENIYQIGYEIGRQCKLVGIHLNLAPIADLNSNPLNPIINERSFGKDKEKVACCCVLINQGMRDAGVLTCAKHFPGHGDTSVDSHLELPIINHDLIRLNEYELYPFQKLIAENIPCIMIAHLEIPALEKDRIPATFSKKVILFLKNDLGFEGLIITDGLGMKALTNHYKPGEIELRALLAGNDILLCPVDVPQAVELIERAIKENLITQQELDEHVLKILKAKEAAGVENRTVIDLNTAMQSITLQKMRA
ncbi:MAG TPA: glycoside hydrolase family 3 protein [Candidatus Babeliales bacterium]|nr:glycoside hydrolase family 3 protein [Candidatus Babeliales bacterium]